MKKISFLLVLIVCSIQCKPTENAFEKPENLTEKTAEDSTQNTQNPKLVVGIVVDQMRYDYLTRFWEQYGENGFKRMINEGYSCANNHYNYVPTYTGPGHTSIYTGTTPKNHGIIANNWYDKTKKESVYCAQDNTVQPVGTTANAGKMSPQRMLSTSVADQNRLHTQFEGKTIGIAIKDRGAILPAGHTANAAYWFHGKNEGRWITSSFYIEELPQWVKNFNASGKAASYFKTWDTYKDIATYTESGNDLNNYEHGFKGKETATFPYDLEKLKDQNGNYDILKSTPYGNNLTTDFALAAVDGEALGKDNTTDFLTISYSSPDYIGHNFGVNAKEIEDNYIRLDKDIERLLAALDEKVGKGEYTVFLTADHGAVHVPSYLKDKKIPAGYVDPTALKNDLNDFTGKEYGVTGLIENVSNNQLFFDHKKLAEKNIEAEKLQEALMRFLLNQEAIAEVYTRKMLENISYQDKVGRLIQNGFSQKRSGDLAFTFKPAHIIYSEKGSTHGSGLNYDTHAPLIFFGKGIRKGKTFQRTEITDIAPTVSALLGIAAPNFTTGQVIYPLFEKE